MTCVNAAAALAIALFIIQKRENTFFYRNTVTKKQATINL
jgi:hypothetical protein